MSVEVPRLHSSPKVLVSSTAVNSFSYNMEYEGYGGRSNRLKHVCALSRGENTGEGILRTAFGCIDDLEGELKVYQTMILDNQKRLQMANQGH